MLRTAGFHGPDLEQRGRIGDVGRKCRRGKFAPVQPAVVRAVQFGAEMAVLERGVGHPVDWQYVGDRNSVKADQLCTPARALAFECKQAFTRRNQQMIAHYKSLTSPITHPTAPA
jgi:hypothetical protein